MNSRDSKGPPSRGNVQIFSPVSPCPSIPDCPLASPVSAFAGRDAARCKPEVQIPSLNPRYGFIARFSARRAAIETREYNKEDRIHTLRR
jgi:hypothetical protein